MYGLRLVGVNCVLVLGLSACGAGDKPAETPRPAMVVHPGGGADAALTAYAGEVRAREESALSFRVGGNLVRRNVDAGARVQRGEVLAVLDPGDLQLQAQAAQAELAAANAELARTRGDRDRYALLVRDKLVSQSTFDAQDAAYKAAEGQARAARAQMEVMRNQEGYSQLRAPRDGLIATRQAEAGQVVAAGQTIYTLAADGGREIAIALPENRIREFRIGQPVLIELWNAPEQRLPGTIREIAAAADPQTRTYAARVGLASDAINAVELGQSARVYVQETGTQAALKLPLSAVQRGSNGRTSVWVVNPADGKVALRPVTLGPYGESEVPVISGVSASDWVVAGGGHLLREGAAVTPVDRDNRPLSTSAPVAPAKKG
ncbi:efflux RND transporter periplasmic adaptor subunit [Pseudoxanthomonas indica]|uniref:Membrane fusion protein, multidrug efflux system n=1 Tax=Pseudoxanthomonas indica TaxID=428993 RepID=A0A1T5K3L5_9GAMM|nr:efflux RND transporter periplasmic adaptor subunit [Pseudoxanthomonas indica]GGD46466.1 resistance-nodulation-cell division (RND) efflux membrane fusion protein [Pseudoxanthomonas indica]SKC58357.1 membrane fusion protein, multidrug efflux system [Pseudoxanthomonas indica]